MQAGNSSYELAAFAKGRPLGLTTSSNSSKKSFSQTEKGMLGSVLAGLGKSGGPLVLKAAADNPEGTFTSTAAELGPGGGEEEEAPMPAVKAAADNP
jgi:hypothetical protein